jgi:hypothetical protein
MSAVILPFPAHNTSAAPVVSTAQPLAEVVRLPSSNSLTNPALRTLKALMPNLEGEWLCEIRTDNGGEVFAVIARDDWARGQFFTAVRQSGKFCLLACCWPSDCELLGVYDGITELADAIGDVAGRRHRAFGGG